jgi:hypothetical protein
VHFLSICHVAVHASQPRYAPVHHASSVSSHDSFTAVDAKMSAAKYEEWPLQGATLKRLIMNGKVTFQLEFSWELCAGDHPRSSHSGKKFQTQKVEELHRTQRSPASHTFTREEKNLIVKLKEEKQLPWSEIPINNSTINFNNNGLRQAFRFITVQS